MESDVDDRRVPQVSHDLGRCHVARKQCLPPRSIVLCLVQVVSRGNQHESVEGDKSCVHDQGEEVIACGASRSAGFGGTAEVVDCIQGMQNVNGNLGFVSTCPSMTAVQRRLYRQSKDPGLWSAGVLDTDDQHQCADCSTNTQHAEKQLHPSRNCNKMLCLWVHRLSVGLPIGRDEIAIWMLIEVDQRPSWLWLGWRRRSVAGSRHCFGVKRL